MLREKAVTLLKIRPDEIRMVMLVAALFLCIQAGQGIGENAAFALFLARLDVDLLPYMYMGLGAVAFLASLAYATSLSRFQGGSVIVYLLAGAVFLFVVEWTVIVILGISLYSVLWLTTYGMSVIFGTLLWTLAGEVCDTRQAKRLFPLFTSMGILGSVLGNSLTGVFAKIAGTENLIILYAILLGIGLLLTREIISVYFKPKSVVITNSLIDDVRAGFDFVRGSPLFRLIAYSSILFSVLFFTVDFPFSEIVSIRFTGDEAGLAGFKGLFTSITTAVTFAVSLFLANRLYARLGIVNSVLVMPLTYVFAFILFFVSFNVWGAVGARFSQLVVLGGLAGTAWNALFNVVPPERRGQVLAFNNGVPSQVGVVLSGLLIILSNTILADTKVVLLLGAVVAVVTVYMTVKMKPAYGEALLSALRAGRIEVFSNEEEAFSGYQHDPAALQVVLKALKDPRANTRRLAAEMLARMDAALAIPDLLERLSDNDATVRAAATQALAALDATMVTNRIILGLDDPDDRVREQTLAALPKLGVASSPELIQTLERLLEDTNMEVRARAAVALIFLREGRQAQLFLSSLISHEDINKRRMALNAFGDIVVNLISEERIPFDVDLILGALNDPSPIVRREAIRVASLLRDGSIYASVAGCLSDKDATVRKNASETLKQAWPESRAHIIQTLEEMDPITLDAALDSIPSGDTEILFPLRGYIQREVSNIQHLRKFRNSLPQEGRAVALLDETLKERESLSEERLIKAIGVFGNPRALDLVRRSLNAGSAATRAAALEALETLGDRKITQEVLPILDSGGIFQAHNDQGMRVAEVIEILLSDEDYWLRGLAARSVADIGLKEFVPLLHELTSDPIPFVRQAADDALFRMDGDAGMKTLKTLSTLECVLLLREVPMFSGLSPEDLEQIADIAQEQLYSTGTLICREGERGSTLFIIVTGKVEVIKGMGKTENVIAVREPGEFVGEMAILESAPRSATLRAQEDVRVLIIEGEAFKAILMDRPEVAISVLQHMSTRVRQLSR
jgi:HEAT repeat protein/ATP/ADP translocase